MKKHLRFLALCLLWHFITYFIWWCRGVEIIRSPILAAIEAGIIIICFWSILPAYDL